MARHRHRYEDVMDVALRATLKEHGFKRKSKASYVCDHSPSRVWIFEIEIWKSRIGFKNRTAIFVPEIEDIVTRATPGIGTYDTRTRNPSQFMTSVAGLIRTEFGWDNATWEANPKSDHWLWGPRAAPEAGKAIPIMDGNSWGYNRAKTYLAKNIGTRELVLRNSRRDRNPEYWRDRDETTEEVGQELDRLWRGYAHEWLQKCDDPRYLAEWLDKYVCSWRGLPVRGPCAFTAATAWHLAGETSRATKILDGIIANFETTHAGRPVAGAQLSNYAKRTIAGARGLADEFGIRLG